MPDSAVSRHATNQTLLTPPVQGSPYSENFIYLVKSLMPKGLTNSYGLRLLSVASAGFSFEICPGVHQVVAAGPDSAPE